MSRRRKRKQAAPDGATTDAPSLIRFFVDKAARLRPLLLEIGEPVVEGTLLPGDSPGEARLRLALPGLPEATLDRLLFRFRPFWLEEERVCFPRVLGRLGQGRPDLHEWLGYMRQEWNRCLFRFTIGDAQLTPEIVLKAALYSDYFHFDEKAAAELRQLKSVFGAAAVHAALVTAVWYRADLVCKFAAEVEQRWGQQLLE